MGNTKYRYDNGKIVEQPRMTRPANYTGHPDNEQAIQLYIDKLKEYENHVASLRRYAAPNWPEKLKGIDLVEGEHFELKKMWSIDMDGLIDAGLAIYKTKL